MIDIQQLMQKLEGKYPGIEILHQPHLLEDASLFHIRKRGERETFTLKMSNTIMADSVIPMQLLEKEIRRIAYPHFDRAKFDERVAEKIKNPTSSWADEWAQKNA